MIDVMDDCTRYDNIDSSIIDMIMLKPFILDDGSIADDDDILTNGNIGGGAYGKCASYTPNIDVDNDAMEHMTRDR